MDEEELRDIAELKAKVAGLRLAVDQLLGMNTVLTEEFKKILAVRQDTNPTGAEQRMRQEVLRLEAMIAGVRALADPIGAYKAAFGHEQASIPHDPSTPICRYCYKVCASSHGRGVHENRCSKNPEAANQAWECTCGTTGISTVGLGHHRRKCKELLVGETPPPAPQQIMTLPDDAITGVLTPGDFRG